MKRKTILSLIALMAVFALLMTGCGKTEPEAETAAPGQSIADSGAELGLTHWELSSTTWSSPNGATVHLTATPAAYSEDQYATFLVRLDGEDVSSTPCQWNGTQFTASAELNAANGYSYYVVLTTESGRQTQVAVNTLEEPIDESLINIETALNTYCNLLVESSESTDGKLTITAGTIQIQPPQLKNQGEAVTCTEAALILSFNGEEVARQVLSLPAAGEDGIFEMPIASVSFDVPEMEDDNILTLQLEAQLSNGYILTDANGTWSYMDGELLGIVG